MRGRFVGRFHVALLRVPDAGEGQDGQRRSERRDDVGEGDGPEVGREVLEDAEGRAAHQRRGPYLAKAALPVDDEHQGQRDEDREDRRLAADHGTQVADRQLRDGRERYDRHRERPEGDRRGVRDQRDCRCLERPEAERDEHDGADGHRRAEAC